MEIRVPPEIEASLRARSIEGHFNSYKSREVARDLTVTVEGAEPKSPTHWISVKGGVKEKTQHQAGISYEILFNPETNEWLKLVPVAAIGKQQRLLTERLQKSIHCGKKALETSELPELAAQLRAASIMEADGSTTFGFIAPHIGPSLEYFQWALTGTRAMIDLSSFEGEVLSFFSTVYRIAFFQAVDLFFRYGIWVDDPNPGNILLHEKDGSVHVVLIDFSNSTQYKEHGFKSLSPERVGIDRYKEIVRDKVSSVLHELARKFTKQCSMRSVPFPVTEEEIQHEIDAYLAILLRRLEVSRRS